MEQLIQLSLWAHIGTGTIALLAGPAAMFTRKGGKNHRLWGKLYFWSMTAVALTAVVISVYKNIPFLLMVAFFSYHFILKGYRVLFQKKRYIGVGINYLDWLLHTIPLVFNLGLIVWGIYLYTQTANSFAFVALAFGAGGTFFCSREIYFLLHPSTDKQSWLYDHISGMMGGYIATLTAFLAVNVHFLPPVVTWLLPSVTVGPFIGYWIRSYKKKFNGGQKAEEVVQVKLGES